MAKGKEKKTTKKAATKKKSEKVPEELRLTQLEQTTLNLCDRDHELSMVNVELARTKLRNLDMDYQYKKAKLVDLLKTSQQKSEQLALIRNRKLAEIEARLRAINEDFSFKDYLEQDDGLLVPNEDKIGALDPTVGDGGDGGDSVTA